MLQREGNTGLTGAHVFCALQEVRVQICCPKIFATMKDQAGDCVIEHGRALHGLCTRSSEQSRMEPHKNGARRCKQIILLTFFMFSTLLGSAPRGRSSASSMRLARGEM